MHLFKTLSLITALLFTSSLSAHADSHSSNLTVDSYVQPASTAPEIVLRKQTHRVLPSKVIELGTWLRAESAIQEYQPGTAFQVGAQRHIQVTQTHNQFQQELEWQSTEFGGSVTAITFHSPEAYSTRLGILVDALPGSASVRVYSTDRSDDQYVTSGQRILQLLQANRDAGDTSEDGRTWWTPNVASESITLEIELPPGTPTSALRIAVPRLMHVYENLLLPLANEEGAPAASSYASNCDLDATCYSSSYEDKSNAVARMFFVKDGGGYVCSGTLLNDRANSATPHFITANHCISTQTVASTLETSWFYRSSACNAVTLSSKSRTLYNGARLLYATDDQDTALMILNDAPPAGVTFSGWDANTATLGTSIVGIHHPNGDLQRISFGSIQSYYDCWNDGVEGSKSCYIYNTPKGNYYAIKWSAGTTEPGSSGSGLFKDGRLTGVLFGGSGSCSSGTDTSIYGRFDKVFPVLSQWLNKEATRPAVARQAVYRFFNRTSRTHFYTNNAKERDQIIANMPSFQYEGTAFYAATKESSGLNAIYRFYNTKAKSHFYTINSKERDSVKANLPHYSYEGPMWYATTQSASDNRPIYRFYNPKTSTHFYTATEAERDSVISSLPEYKYEGIAYYVWNTP